MDDCCNKCPLKLYNDEFYQGVGSRVNGSIIFILQKYDKEIINDIVNLYQTTTSKSFNENCYITFKVRCDTKNSLYDVYEAALHNCLYKLYKDIVPSNFKYYFVFGGYGYPIIGNGTKSRYELIYKRKVYNVFPSERIKYCDSDKYDSVLNDIKELIIKYNL